MTARNTYATLAEYKAFVTSRGQTVAADVTDDLIIDSLLEQASRYIDGKTSRKFYPTIETRSYNLPDYELLFDADVLEVITLSNGDGSAIASTEYNLKPANEFPKYGLSLKGSSSVMWESDSNGNNDSVIDLLALYGFHTDYTREAWESVGTLGEAITDTTTLAFTMTAGHSLAVGNIARIDNELFIIGTVATNTITPLKRGDNGSTAITHLNGASVSVWQPMADCKNATLEIAMQAYKRRFGQSLSNTETVTASGVVLTPKDIPTLAGEFMKTYRRLV